MRTWRMAGWQAATVLSVQRLLAAFNAIWRRSQRIIVDAAAAECIDRHHVTGQSLLPSYGNYLSFYCKFLWIFFFLWIRLFISAPPTHILAVPSPFSNAQTLQNAHKNKVMETRQRRARHVSLRWKTAVCQTICSKSRRKKKVRKTSRQRERATAVSLICPWEYSGRRIRRGLSALICEESRPPPRLSLDCASIRPHYSNGSGSD